MRPLATVVSALVLVVAAVGVAFAGVGPSGHGGDLPPGAVTVGGVDPSSGEAVRLDLSRPVAVGGAVPTAAMGSDRVVLELSVVGVTVEEVSAPLPPTSGRFETTFDLRRSRHLLAGRITARLAFLGPAGLVAAERRFAVQSSTSPFLTLPAAAGLVLILWNVAYLESVLLSMRRGRRRVTGVVATTLLGIPFGVAIVLVAGITGRREPRIPTLVACAALGAAAAAVASLGALRAGSRRRPRRAERPEPPSARTSA